MAEAIRLRIVLEDGVSPSLARLQLGLLAMQRTANTAFGRGTRLRVDSLNESIKGTGSNAQTSSRNLSNLASSAGAAFGSRTLGRAGAFSRVLGPAGVAGAAGLAGAAIVGLGVTTGKVFVQNDRIIREANSLFTGFSENTRNQIRNTGRTLAVDLHTSIVDVTAAYRVAGGAGLSFSDSQKFVNETLRFATANFTAVEPAAQIAIQAVNAFNLEMADLAKVTNTLTIAYDEGVFKSFVEFSGTLDKVAVPAQQLGLRLEEVSAAMSIMTQAGFTGARASTSLARLLTELDRVGGRVSERFKEVAGVSFRDFIRQGNTLTDGIDLMAQAAQKGDQTFNEFFGGTVRVRATRALGTLANRTTDVNALIRQMDSGVDALGPKIEENLGGAQGAFKELGSRVGVAADEIGEFVVASAKPLVDVINDISSEFDTASSAISDFVGWLDRAVLGQDQVRTAEQLATFARQNGITAQELVNQTQERYVQLLDNGVSPALAANQAVSETLNQARIDGTSLTYDNIAASVGLQQAYIDDAVAAREAELETKALSREIQAQGQFALDAEGQSAQFADLLALGLAPDAGTARNAITDLAIELDAYGDVVDEVLGSAPSSTLWESMLRNIATVADGLKDSAGIYQQYAEIVGLSNVPQVALQGGDAIRRHVSNLIGASTPPGGKDGKGETAEEREKRLAQEREADLRGQLDFALGQQRRLTSQTAVEEAQGGIDELFRQIVSEGFLDDQIDRTNLFQRIGDQFTSLIDGFKRDQKRALEERMRQEEIARREKERIEAEAARKVEAERLKREREEEQARKKQEQLDKQIAERQIQLQLTERRDAFNLQLSNLSRTTDAGQAENFRNSLLRRQADIFDLTPQQETLFARELAFRSINERVDARIEQIRKEAERDSTTTTSTPTTRTPGVSTTGTGTGTIINITNLSVRANSVDEFIRQLRAAVDEGRVDAGVLT